MSYQKKSAILQELQNAIRKKAQQKSKNKDHVNKILQCSIQNKKRQGKKHPSNKEVRQQLTQKTAQEIIYGKQQKIQKGISIFNKQQLATTETKELKLKKYNNRKIDKLVSLINYMVSSSEKAIKYISSSNFQAEFAIKLYRSDKQNLMNQLQHLNFEDILKSQRSNEKFNQKNDQNVMLLQQNSRIKKEILILQKQALRFHIKNNVEENDNDYTAIMLEKQNGKLHDSLQKILHNQKYTHLMEKIQKQLKYELFIFQNQNNSKKIQIQAYLNSLESDRHSNLQNSNIVITQRTNAQMTEIQEEKIQLQKQIAALRVKINQMSQSSKAIAQYQSLKNNMTKMYQNVLLFVNQTYSYSQHQSLEGLINFIEIQLLNKIQQNKQLIQLHNQCLHQIQSLKKQSNKNRVDAHKIVQVKQRLQKIQKQKYYKQIKLHKLEQEIDNEKEKAKQLQVIYDKTLQSNKRLQSNLQNVQELIKKQQDQIKIYKNQNNQLKQKLNQLSKDKILLENKKRQTLNQLQNVKAKLQNYCTNQTDTIQRQNKEISKLSALNKNLTIKWQQSQNQVAKNYLLLQNLNCLISQNAQLKGQIKVNDSRIKILEEKNNKFIKTIEYEKQIAQKKEAYNKNKLTQIQHAYKQAITNNKLLEQRYLKSEQNKINIEEKMNIYRQNLSQQNDLNRFRMKQYICLLKKILKGLGIEEEIIISISTIQQLLQLGCNSVVKTKKRLREQESNRRKQRKDQRQLQYEDVDLHYITKALQFQSISNITNQITMPFVTGSKHQYLVVNTISQFDSGITQKVKYESPQMLYKQPFQQQAVLYDKQYKVLQETVFAFNQIEINKQNQSINLQKIQKQYQKIIFSNFQDIKDDKLNKSAFSGIQNQGNVQQNFSDFQDIQAKKLNQSEISQQSKQNNKEANLSEFMKVSTDQLHQSVISNNPNQNFMGNFSEFHDMNEDKLNQSASSEVANQHNILEEQSEFQNFNEKLLTQSVLSEEQQQQFVLYNLSQFQQLNQKLSESILSEKCIESGQHFDDFNDLQSNKGNQSIISDKHEIDAFDEIANIQDNNNSIFSEKSDENDKQQGDLNRIK